jgi:ketosteroid isomerase-like protein
MKIRSFAFLAVAMVVAALSINTSAQTADEKALQKADQDWLKVFAAEDLKKSVDFVLADGSMLAPNAPIATGHDAVGKLVAGFFALPSLKMKWTPERTQIAKSGDMGVTSGTYEMAFGGPGGITINDKGKYVTVWKKTGGVWKVWLDIFNSDLAAFGN